ncbi:MAG: hypothetical protein Q8O30_10175 [Candidatus Omnitrophota bacterium]|nr:hypothetical protein [Candidatus Omnitrophota bacterium]
MAKVKVDKCEKDIPAGRQAPLAPEAHPSSGGGDSAMGDCARADEDTMGVSL